MLATATATSNHLQYIGTLDASLTWVQQLSAHLCFDRYLSADACSTLPARTRSISFRAAIIVSTERATSIKHPVHQKALAQSSCSSPIAHRTCQLTSPPTTCIKGTTATTNDSSHGFLTQPILIAQRNDLRTRDDHNTCQVHCQYLTYAHVTKFYKRNMRARGVQRVVGDAHAI